MNQEQIWERIESLNMRIQDIKYNDVANGDGLRVSIWVSGCFIHCKGCFNKEAWDYNSGRLFTKEDYDAMCEELSSSVISGITILGGEPLGISQNYPESYRNANFTGLMSELAKSFNKSVWVYSGKTYKDLKKYNHLEGIHRALNNIDVLVDGPFKEHLIDRTTSFVGSTNQKIINIKHKN